MHDSPTGAHEGIDPAVLDIETHGWTVRQWLEVDPTVIQRRTTWAITWWISLVWKRTYVGADRIPDRGGVLSCPNHTHWIDAWIQGLGHTRRPVRYFAKSSLVTDRWIGGYLKRTGSFPVVRGGSDAAAINLAELIL